MADTIGIRFGVEGEKELKAALRDIDGGLKVLVSEMKLLSTEYDKNDKSVEALTARNKILNKEAEEQANKVDVLQQALDNAKNLYGENSREVQSWQIKLNNAKGQLNNLNSEINQNEQELENARNSTEDLGDELEETGKKSSGFGDICKAAGAAIAASFAAVSAAIIAGTKALADMAVETAAYADDMLTMSTVTGMSTESLQAYSYAADLVDVSMDTLTKTMAKNIKSMDAAREGSSEAGAAFEKLGLDLNELGGGAWSIQELEKEYKSLVDTAMNGKGDARLDAQDALESLGISFLDLQQTEPEKLFNKFVDGTEKASKSSSKMADAYNALGVTVTDSNGKLRDGETVYWEAIDALGKMEEGAERDALAMQIFGKSAQDLNPLIAVGSAGVAQLVDEAKSMGAIMSESQLEMAGAFDDSIQRLTQGSESAKRALGTVLMPQFTQLADLGSSAFGQLAGAINSADGDYDAIAENVSGVLQEVLGQVNEVIPQILEQIGGLITALGEALSDNAPMIIDTIGTVLDNLINVVSEILPVFVDIALQIVFKLVDGLIENLPKLINAGMEIITSVITGIANALPSLIPAVVECVTTIVETLIDSLPMILGAALQLITGLANGLLKAIPVLIAALPKIINGLLKFIVDAIPQIVAVIPQIIDSVISALTNSIPIIIDSVINAAIELVPLIIDAGFNLLVALIEDLPKIINSVTAAIPDIIGGLINAFSDNQSEIIQTGVTLLTSIIKDLPMIIESVVAAIPDIIDGLVNAIIESVPLIMQAGGDLFRGLWEGISGVADWLWENVKGMLDGLTNKIKNFFGIASPSKLFRDEIGQNLALGLGIGFSNEMEKVSKDMQNSIPTKFDITPEINAMKYSVADWSTPKALTVEAVESHPVIVSLSEKFDSLGKMFGSLAELLEKKFLPAMDKNIMLDDGTIIGKWASPMDIAMANRTLMAVRS